MRTNLTQKPAGKNTEGELSFFHCNNDLSNSNNYENVLNYLEIKHGWDFNFQNTIACTLFAQQTRGRIENRLRKMVTFSNTTTNSGAN